MLHVWRRWSKVGPRALSSHQDVMHWSGLVGAELGCGDYAGFRHTGSQHVPDVVVISVARWVIVTYFDEDLDGADLDERSLSSQVASQEMAAMNPSSAAQMLKAVFLHAFSRLGRSELERATFLEP